MKIYHNPRCSKSRDSYKLLQEKNIEFETIEYLKNPITKEELTDLLSRLGIPAMELIRKGEAQYKENYKGKNLSEEQWVDAMIKFPKLMEPRLSIPSILLT